MFIQRKSTRRKKGFTLAEITIVVAILAIVAAIGIPFIGNFIIDLEMSRVNNSAKQIYLAAQNNLVSMRTAGTLESDIASSTELEALKIGTSELVFADSRKTVMDSYILPVGTITDEIRRDGEYIIVFDKKFGLMQEVYFAESGMFGAGTVDSSTLALWRVDAAARRDDRVGYYNGTGNASSIVDQLPEPKLELINNEVLSAKVTFPRLPRGLSTSDVQVIFRVENIEADTQMVEWRLTPESSDFDNSDPGTREYTKTLDSLDKSFSTILVNDAGVCPIAVGANIKVTATLSLMPGTATPGITLRDSVSVTKTTNSLFNNARVETSGGKPYYVAEITSGRHLSNLNLLTNPTAALAGTESVFIARQMSNLNFGSDGHWQATYGARKSPMVGNTSLLIYDGLGNALSNTTQPLFKVFGEALFTTNDKGDMAPSRWDYRLQNARIISPKITDFAVPPDNPYFGVLACAASGATISNCKVYGLDSDLKVADFQQTGGLVGFAYGTAVINSSVAVPKMKVIPGKFAGDTIGGLIGAFYLPVFNESTLVSGCYVNISELFVENPNRKGGTVGMLIGYNWQGATIDNCYTVGAIIGNPPRACGLIGTALSTNTFAKEHIYNCYVLVDLSSVGTDRDGNFAAFGSDSRRPPTHVSNVFYVESVASYWAARDAARKSTPITLDQLRAGKIGDVNLFTDPSAWKFGGTSAEPFTSTLGSTYPYPGLNAMGLHQGDWPR